MSRRLDYWQEREAKKQARKELLAVIALLAVLLAAGWYAVAFVASVP